MNYLNHLTRDLKTMCGFLTKDPVEHSVSLYNTTYESGIAPVSEEPQYVFSYSLVFVLSLYVHSSSTYEEQSVEPKFSTLKVHTDVRYVHFESEYAFQVKYVPAIAKGA